MRYARGHRLDHPAAFFGLEQGSQPLGRAVTEIVVALVRRRKIGAGGFTDSAHLLEREDPQERRFAANRRADHFCGDRQRGDSRQQLKRRVVVPSRELDLRFVVQPDRRKRLTGILLHDAPRPLDRFVELAGVAQAIDNVAMRAFKKLAFRISGDEILVTARGFFVSAGLLQVTNRRSSSLVRRLSFPETPSALAQTT